MPAANQTRVSMPRSLPLHVLPGRQHSSPKGFYNPVLPNGHLQFNRNAWRHKKRDSLPASVTCSGCKYLRGARKAEPNTQLRDRSNHLDSDSLSSRVGTQIEERQERELSLIPFWNLNVRISCEVQQTVTALGDPSEPGRFTDSANESQEKIVADLHVTFKTYFISSGALFNVT
ncbi:hypothetical protein HF521_015698 [Silurus meridionalis]|uniref:Uncharacterized protein n=1 Tax=Silurus meridionalis TaxID=175797 RepID=A0A8T0A5Y5_SILME|nr:hypothetical protein HF521_015698 [Silurus meridionalis]